MTRRNLAAYTRAELALALEKVFTDKAKEKELERKTTCQKSDKSLLPVMDTKRDLAKIANVSHDTIAKSTEPKSALCYRSAVTPLIREQTSSTGSTARRGRQSEARPGPMVGSLLGLFHQSGSVLCTPGSRGHQFQKSLSKCESYEQPKNV